MSYKMKSGETENAYIYRICAAKDQIGTWYDVRDILNAELGRNWTESAYRKKFQEGLAYLNENQDAIFNDEEYLNKLRDEREALQRERYKLQTEKLEYNRWLREHARDELFEEKVINAINMHLGASEYVPRPILLPEDSIERSGILCLADMHFGAEFKLYGIDNRIVNEYSPEIFYHRMELLLNMAIEYIKRNDLRKIHVLNLGDSLEGFIRHNQAFSLRYGVVESAVILADYLSDWLKRLSNHVHIVYSATSGNHGELRLLDGIKGDHLNDNIEVVVNHIIELANKDNPNFKMNKNKSGMIYIEAAGYKIMGIHGEVKDMEAAIKDYADIYDVKIDYLIGGHKHYSNYANCGVRKGVIGIGSIIGNTDYSVKIRKSADPTASMIIFESGKGKTDEHTFVLN